MHAGDFDKDKPHIEQRCLPSGELLGTAFDLHPDETLTARKPAAPLDSNATHELDLYLSGGSRNQVTTPMVQRLGLEVRSYCWYRTQTYNPTTSGLIRRHGREQMAPC